MSAIHSGRLIHDFMISVEIKKLMALRNGIQKQSH